MLGIGLLAMVMFHCLAAFLRSHLLAPAHAPRCADDAGFLRASGPRYPAPFSSVPGDLMMRVNSNAQIREMLTPACSLACWMVPWPACTWSFYLARATWARYVVLLGVLQAGRRLPVVLPPLSGLDVPRFASTIQSASHLVQMLAGIETLKAKVWRTERLSSGRHLFVDELNVALKRGRLSATVEALMSALHIEHRCW